LEHEQLTYRHENFTVCLNTDKTVLGQVDQ
jgi:hypothetical protein